MELSRSDNAIYEVGNYTVRFSKEGQKPAEEKGKYIGIWKHNASGWKMHRLIWNTNTPPQK